MAGPHELALRWPDYWVALEAQSAYRAVMSLPLYGAFTGTATMDLYMADTAQLRHVPIAGSVVIADLVALELAQSLVGTTSTRRLGPEARVEPPRLDTPAAQARLHVWQAMGMLDGDLKVTDRESLTLLTAHADAHALSLATVAALLVSGDLTAHDLATS